MRPERWRDEISQPTDLGGEGVIDVITIHAGKKEIIGKIVKVQKGHRWREGRRPEKVAIHELVCVVA